MKGKLLLMVTLMGMLSSSFAAVERQDTVLLVNTNSLHTIEINYQFCHLAKERLICDPSRTSLIIPNSQTSIPAPVDSGFIRVNASVEKDDFGSIIAMTNYRTRQGMGSFCVYPMTKEDGKRNNVAIVLSDPDGSHTITCEAKDLTV